MPGRQVGEPVGRGLVGHRVGVAQVLDGDVLGRLGPAQQRQRAALRDQQRRREVVDLHPLLAGTPSSPAAPRDPARRGRAPAAPATGSRAGRRPAAAGRRCGCARSVTVRVDSGRSEVCTSRNPRCAASRSTTVRVIGPPSYLVAVSRSAATLLDLAEVVVLPAHPLPQVGVGPPGLLRGGGPLRPARRRAPGAGRPAPPAPRSAAAAPAARPGCPAPGNAVGALRLLQFDLQRGAAAGRRDGQQVGAARCPAPPARADSTDSFASRLPFSISDSADGLIAGDAGDVGQRLALAPADVPQPAADGQRIGELPTGGISRAAGHCGVAGVRPGSIDPGRADRVDVRCRDVRGRDAWSRRGRRSPV